MTDASPSASSLSEDEWSLVDDAVDHLQQLWRSSVCPDIALLLPVGDGPLRLRVLVELIKIDQELRDTAGAHKSLEVYLQEWPVINEDLLLKAELLAAECYSRGAAGDLPTMSELRSRFSDAADRVDLHQIEVDLWQERFTGSNQELNSSNLDHRPSSGKLAAKSRFGRYELRGELGAGAMGTVYRAYDTQLRREVALKIPRFESGLAGHPTLRERFYREARAVSGVHHPNVCQIYDIGEINGTYYFTMALIEGQSLTDWMKIRGQTASFKEKAQLVAKLADAASALHCAGIVHRDIKPSNVVIDKDRRLVLMDFGLARKLDADVPLTRTGELLGTPAYMSPEQAANKPIDERSDIFSIGVILFQLLTGELPFRGDSHIVVTQILESEPVRLRRKDKRIPRDLETICLKCLEKSTNRRFATALQISQELTRFQNGEPILSRPVGRLEQIWRFSQRKPIVASLSGILLLLLLLITIAAPVIVIHEANLRITAEASESSMHAAKETAETEKLAAKNSRRQVETAGAALRNESTRLMFFHGNAEYASGRLQSGCEELFRAWASSSDSSPLKSSYERVLIDRLTRGQRSWVELPGIETSPERSTNRLVFGGAALTSDGSRIVSAPGDNTLQIWDATTGRPIGKQITHNTAVITSVSISPDGLRVLTEIQSQKQEEILSIVVDEEFCQAATSWDLTPSMN